MRKLVIGLAAAISVAAVVPANADGLWIGVPGIGIGIGTGPAYGYGPYPAYGYGPYYDGYRGDRYWDDSYAYAPTYSGYAYEPEFEYGAYAYEPAYGYATYSYGRPVQDYGYARTYSYRHDPSVRYSRGYDERIRTVRSKSHYDAISRDRTMVRDANSRRHAGMSVNFEDRTGRRTTETASRRVGSEASRAMARSDKDNVRVPRSKSSETTGKATLDRRSP